METKKCKNCGRSIDKNSNYDTCDNCRNKDIEKKKDTIITLGVIALFATGVYNYFKKKGK